MKKGKLIAGLFLAILLVAGGFGYYEYSQVRQNPPTLTLAGEQTMELLVGTPYEEPGYEATSGAGRDLTEAVEVDLPEMKHSGDYDITYRVKDKYGNEATATRHVTVKLPPPTKAGADRGLSVLMYHNVYDPANPDGPVDSNVISMVDLENQFKYLVEQGYYFPTWDEVSAYVRGQADLPEKSVVLTFDDGAKRFEKNGVPLIEKYDLEATAFIIAGKNGAHWVEMDYDHLHLQSHTYDMHRDGGTYGHGGIMPMMTVDQIVADLKKCDEVLGPCKVIAYPYGDCTEVCEQGTEKAGYLLGFTTEYGKVHPGMNPYKLPRVRINAGISMEAFIGSL